ncbi:MAG: hypothetical protein QHH04_07235 [Methanolinea sp.]|nr:hypothetical protein [Methanolinea sp.]
MTAMFHYEDDTDMNGHILPPGNRKGREDLHETADRWLRAARALPEEDRPYAEYLAAMIRSHATDRMTVIRDPLEAAVFSLLIELVKARDGEGGVYDSAEP